MIVEEIQVSFEYGGDDAAIRREIIRNVRTVLSTPIGTCPLYREFGLDVAYLDYPLDLARNLFSVAAMEAIEKWEPRVRVKDVSFESSGVDGNLKAKVVVADGQSAKIRF